MSKTRNHRSAEEKAALLRRHHIDKVPVTTICEEAGLQPSVLYHWRRELFERAAHVPGNGSTGRPSSREQEPGRKVSALEARLTKKVGISRGKFFDWRHGAPRQSRSCSRAACPAGGRRPPDGHDSDSKLPSQFSVEAEP